VKDHSQIRRSMIEYAFRLQVLYDEGCISKNRFERASFLLRRSLRALAKDDMKTCRRLILQVANTTRSSKKSCERT